MDVQVKTYSKQYIGYSGSSLQAFLRVDSTAELQDIYNDAVDYAENYIHKDIAYTLKEYIIEDFGSDEILIDEGFYNSISAITYTDYNGGVHTVSGYTVSYVTSYNFLIEFNECISAEYLHIKFFTSFNSADKIPRGIKRAIYVICSDLFDWERSSYSVQSSKRSDVIERLLNPYRKDFFINYKYNC